VLAGERHAGWADLRGDDERHLVLQGQQRPEPSVAPYFVEEIRKSLEQEFGADALYQNGLQVQTTLDAELQEAVAREGAASARDALAARGGEIGAARMIALAEAANRNPPVLKLFDATGHRRDVVEFHPAYHELMAYLARHGAAAGPWVAPAPGAHAARAALYCLYAQLEDGTLCPTTMTYASVPALRNDQALAAQWLPRILSNEYDPRFIPPEQKRGVTIGMGMTEKQGGSDVRANTTRAEPVGGRAYRVVGHKWFFSAPMCDAFLILAQAQGGL